MLRFTIAVVSIMGLLAYGWATVSLCESRIIEIGQFRSAFIGLVTGAGLWLGLRKRLGFFSVFEHELTHLIFSILMFQRPRSFYASERRGHVSCDRGNFVDGLAPYFFPTFSYLLLTIYPLLKTSAHTYFYPALGFLTGYQVIAKLGEFRPGQSDIRRYGTVFSVLFCTFAGILAFGFLLAFMIGGSTGGIEFLKSGWHRAASIILYAGRYLRNFITDLIT
jgi:hypothetical protein